MVKQLVMLFTVLILLSCGARKVQNKKEVTKNEEKTLVTENNLEKSTEVKKDSTYTEEKNSIQVDRSKYRTVEVFDSLGRLKKRTTEDIKTSKRDNGSKRKVNVLEEKKDKINYITKTVTQTIYQTKYLKEKETDKKAPMWLIICFPVLIIGILLFVYYKVR